MGKGSNKCNVTHKIAKLEMRRLSDPKNRHMMDKEIDEIEI